MESNKQRAIINSVNIKDLNLQTEEGQNSKKTIEASVHEVKVVKLAGSDSLWFYKTNKESSKKKTTDHKNCEYEAAASAFYRKIVGDRVSITKVVVNDAGERLGVISEGIKGYQSFKQAAIEKQIFNRYAKAGLTKEELLKGDIAGIIVSSYIGDENDQHLGNIGFRTDKIIVKIDHDQSFRTLTIKYTDGEEQQIYLIPIHAEDIETLPVFNIAKPHRTAVEAMTSCLRTINKDPDFERQKYTYFLKSILIGPDALKKIANDNFSTEKGRQRFFDYFSNRLQKVEEELFKVAPFIKFLRENPNIGEVLLAKFDPSEHEYVKEKLQNIYKLASEIDINKLMEEKLEKEKISNLQKNENPVKVNMNSNCQLLFNKQVNKPVVKPAQQNTEQNNENNNCSIQ